MARLHSCNILVAGPVDSQLWQFAVGNGEVELNAQATRPLADRFPPRLVAKDWRALWQRKVNLAWLPSDQVFVRVVSLPTSDASEIPAMLELQLERLSPLPVNQIVWSFQALPVVGENEATVVVFIISRGLVEEFLGQLEAQGYLADRLELPFLHQLLATDFDEDGAWIYPNPVGGKNFCLVAWWYGGTLRSLNLIHLPTSDSWADALEQELEKLAWAGEIEGWLTSGARFKLVADAATAGIWAPVMNRIGGGTVPVIEPLAPQELAALNARRIARSETQVNLLPAEFAGRYRQQFIDRLWMRLLGAAIILYLAGVLVYFGALQWVRFQQRQTAGRTLEVTPQFNQAQQLKARIQILQDQADLKYAALDCWRAVIETLPTELTLTQVNFNKGEVLKLNGVAPGDQDGTVTDYVEALGRYTRNNILLFRRVAAGSAQRRPGALGPQTIYWSIECEIQRTAGT